MKRMLVPIDGSRVALRALAHAITEVKSRPGTVDVLNVEPELDDRGMVRAYVTKQQHRKAMALRAADLLAPATKELSLAKAKYRTHVVYGDPARAIVRTARRLKCDSIVMGTRGMGAIGNLFLGSVATKVVHLSDVPVTLIR